MRLRVGLQGAAVLLILYGQLAYLPERKQFWRESWQYAQADVPGKERLAYGNRIYDLLEWVQQNIPPTAPLLLLTPDGRRGDNLYHRALYQLYPRIIQWRVPLPCQGYPCWWTPIDNPASIRMQGWVLAEGFTEPPVTGEVRRFDAEAFLVFVGDAP